ncbi:MAG TPA: lipase family protein [Pyrinomonadaceae bacterium]|nr:lipase family protein [Pyrinomonadaceae bacterium]
MPERKKPLPHVTLKNAPPPYDEEKGDYVYFADGGGRPCAERIPFRPDARGFDLVNAWWLCEAATLVYSDPGSVRGIFTQRAKLPGFKAFSTDGGTECFVASNDDFAIVAFRGSELTPREDDRHNYSNIVKDWLGNADIHADEFGDGARIHRGFYAGVTRLMGEGFLQFIAGLPARRVWFTGHSLGAALATAAAARLLADGGRLDGLYTFGSPRVGDEVFADALKRMMGGRSHYRFVNGNDVVTTVPLRSLPPDPVNFKHVGTLMHIDGRGRITDDPSRFVRLKMKAADFFDQFEGDFLNGIPNAVEDHVPTLYSTHIWNAYADE